MTKKVRHIIINVIVFIITIVAIIVVSQYKNKVVCSRINIEVLDSDIVGFVNPKSVQDNLRTKFPNILGSFINSVRSDVIEKYVLKNKAVKTCEVYYSIKGVLNIKITQRKPILRVFKKNKSFYIDEDLNKMPIFNTFVARVLVLNGNVDKIKDFSKLLNFVRFIINNEFWNSQFEQIYVESNGYLSLIPRVGDHIIVLGSLDNYKEKLRNLFAFYSKGINPREWNNYKTINLQFENQVVCTKK